MLCLIIQWFPCIGDSGEKKRKLWEKHNNLTDYVFCHESICDFSQTVNENGKGLETYVGGEMGWRRLGN